VPGNQPFPKVGTYVTTQCGCCFACLILPRQYVLRASFLTFTRTIQLQNEKLSALLLIAALAAKRQCSTQTIALFGCKLSYSCTLCLVNRRSKEIMTSLSVGVKCTVHDGVLWMRMNDMRVKVPSGVVNQSQILLNVLSSVADGSIATDVTLPAPKEWLQAWAYCYCSEQKRLACVDNKDLISCLLVCFYGSNAATF
jgi:hypothetical protein